MALTVVKQRWLVARLSQVSGRMGEPRKRTHAAGALAGYRGASIAQGYP